MTSVRIDKGIPIPPKFSNKWTPVILKMKVGDSVRLANASRAINMRMAAQKLKINAISRKVKGGYRVWITK